MSWPEGFGRALLLEGRARDLLTAADGEARVLAQSTLRTLAARDRTIEAIESDPPSPGLERLVGQQGGGRLRPRSPTSCPRRSNGEPRFTSFSTIWPVRP